MDGNCDAIAAAARDLSVARITVRRQDSSTEHCIDRAHDEEIRIEGSPWVCRARRFRRHLNIEGMDLHQLECRAPGGGVRVPVVCAAGEAQDILRHDRSLDDVQFGGVYLTQPDGPEIDISIACLPDIETLRRPSEVGR
jgi:hypothetical protein